ncbi:MAG: hypothetical protein KatS3mg058_1730 [Roseiflexus sp.]|nr:MAG: hypothetical protein KatS3mg058_1730 [Roseiflexus sp.]
MCLRRRAPPGAGHAGGVPLLLCVPIQGGRGVPPASGTSRRGARRRRAPTTMCAYPGGRGVPPASGTSWRGARLRRAPTTTCTCPQGARCASGVGHLPAWGTPEACPYYYVCLSRGGAVCLRRRAPPGVGHAGGVPLLLCVPIQGGRGVPPASGTSRRGARRRRAPTTMCAYPGGARCASGVGHLPARGTPEACPYYYVCLSRGGRGVPPASGTSRRGARLRRAPTAIHPFRLV